MSRIGIVDLDPLPYEAGNAFGEASFPGEVSEYLEKRLRKLWKGLRTEDCEYYLTHSASNFRIEIANIRQYKGGRNSAKPYYFDYAREYLQEKLGKDCVEVYGYEADDACADRIMQLGEDGVLASIDKDLLCVPGYHYNPGWANATEKAIHYQNEADAWRFLYCQVLLGDTTDGITGCFKIGKVKAQKLLAECQTQEEMLQVVKDTYLKTYGPDPIKFQDWRHRWIEMDWDQIRQENEQLIWMGMDNRPEFNYESNYRLV